MASSDLLAKSFLPCTLHPLRVNTTAPPSHQERALELQGNRSPSAPQMPEAHRAAAAAPISLKDVPARALAMPTGKAQMAAVDRWRKSEITIAFFDGQPTSFLNDILELAQQWADLTKLTFKRITNPGEADIRVGFNLGSGQDGGHWSYIAQEAANLPRGSKTMNLAISPNDLQTDPYAKAVVLHEFGHAVGAGHEHMSPGSGGIKFDERKTLQYFWQHYGWSQDMTYANVLHPYQAGDLKMFSDFDPDSIMLYQYPGDITVDGRGTKQNYELSKTDKEYIAKLYGQTVSPPGPVTPPVPVTPVTPPATKTITPGGPAVEGAITPTAAVNTFAFEITASGDYTLRTSGHTQVMLRLFKDDKPVDFKNEWSPDLVNRAATAMLATGKYRVEVRHRVEGGGVGEFAIKLAAGG